MRLQSLVSGSDTPSSLMRIQLAARAGMTFGGTLMHIPRAVCGMVFHGM